jgi:hypothetical protein
MPDPAANMNPGYTWLYRFLHTIAGNLSTAISEAARYRACALPSGMIPGLKPLVLLLAIPLLLVTPACALHYTVHPGALNPADSAAYDTLLIAESTIDQARLDFKSGQLPAGAKPALDALVESYNIARDSWLTYRAAISTNAPGEAQARQRAALIDVYLSQLNQNLTDLAGAIRTLREPANASPTGRSHQSLIKPEAAI